MSPSSSSPPQTPVTTLDESLSTSIKSPLFATKHVTRPQPTSPSSSCNRPAPPAPPHLTPRHRTSSTSTSMSSIQSKVQPNSPSQNLTTSSTSIKNSTSCLILPEPTTSLRRDQPAKASSQPFSSGIVDPVSLSTSRQSITPSFSFPGATKSATTYDRTFPNSTESLCALSTAHSTESFLHATSQQTPNVYINGLPPHCSEQDLFALARLFGDIKSVRTFTRHVSEKPTGYGFVLFNDVESAQRCIDGLRKYRNLHPSFSKLVHRIPGTEYAQHSVVSTDQDENSFKTRMEKLKDANSTNLYIEGLPMTIDEESLSALIQPYKIKSSRFFKTKLSNPPRIIAFVRLETRAAAEETIERLHGRMVRGWNDPGCRISVRFADSAEQRELRRAERTSKNGDPSPSRLTIAQAALLNLRGQELQTNIRDIAGSKHQRLANSRPDPQTVLNPICDPGLFPTSRSLPSKLSYAYRESPLLATPDLPNTSEMDTLLQSIQNGYDDGSLDNAMRSLSLDPDYLVTQQAQFRALANAALLSPKPLPLLRGHAQARNGFTPAEELILEAHAQRLQLQAQLSQTSPIFQAMSNTNMRSIDSGSHEALQTPGLVGKGMLYQDTLPTISEDSFHMGHRTHGFALHEFQGLVNGAPPSVPATRSTIFARPPSRAVSIVPPPPDYEEPGKRLKGHHQSAERSVVSKQISCPSSFNSRRSISLSEGSPHPCLLQASTRSNNMNNSSVNNNTSTISRDKNKELQHTYMYSHGDARSSPEEDNGSLLGTSAASHIYAKKSPKIDEHHSSGKEELKSPSVLSPALTYSSRTPSTLSPATPFFGSFIGGQDAFEMMTTDEEMAERKLKGRVANNPDILHARTVT